MWIFFLTCSTFRICDTWMTKCKFIIYLLMFLFSLHKSFHIRSWNINSFFSSHSKVHLISADTSLSWTDLLMYANSVAGLDTMCSVIIFFRIICCEIWDILNEMTYLNYFLNSFISRSSISNKSSSSRSLTQIIINTVFPARLIYIISHM